MKKFLITLFSLVCIGSGYAENTGTSVLGVLCGVNQNVNDFCEPEFPGAEGHCRDFITKSNETKRLICVATKCEDGYLLWLDAKGNSMGACHSVAYANDFCAKGCGCNSDEKCVPWIVDTPNVKVNGHTFTPKKDGAYSECHCVPGSGSDMYVPDEELSMEIDNVTSEYFAGYFDLATAKEVCMKVFDYADAHNIKIYVKESDGNVTRVDKYVCDTSKYGNFAMPMLVSYILIASRQIKAANVEPHSKSKQIFMKQAAKTNCIEASDIDILKREGYETFDMQSVVECSDTDRRCIVSMPIKKQGDDKSFFTACCMVDVSGITESDEMNIDEKGTSRNEKIDSVSVYGRVRTSVAPVLSDFGYDCKYKKR